MYDIVKTETGNGVIRYFALGDAEEDRYQQKLADCEKNNSGESMPCKTVTVHLAKYFTVEKHILVFLSSLRCSSTHIKILSDFLLYTSPCRNIFSPPPDKMLDVE